MNRHFLGLERKPSNMDLELSRNNSSSETNESTQSNPLFAELQLRRNNRRTSESQKLPERQDLTNQIPPSEDPLIHRQQDKRNEEVAVDSGASDVQEIIPQQRSNSQHEAAEPRLLNPFSFLSSLLSRPHDISRPNENPTSSQLSQPSLTHESSVSSNNSMETENQNQQENNQSEQGHNRFSHGAFLVRTIQPGPNGTVIVRMRVIPLSEIFEEHQEENDERNEEEQPEVFGNLLHMLMGLHGGNQGSFFNLFQEERGLDKEDLESLPVVKYNYEKFKNVDDELKRCPICLDCFEEEQEIRFLWCLHRFHKNCVDQWLNTHTNCPICKKDYSEASEVKTSE